MHEAFLAISTEFVLLPWRHAVRHVVHGASQGGSQVSLALTLAACICSLHCSCWDGVVMTGKCDLALVPVCMQPPDNCFQSHIPPCPPHLAPFSSLLPHTFQAVH